jgi:hypothetical protein
MEFTQSESTNPEPVAHQNADSLASTMSSEPQTESKGAILLSAALRRQFGLSSHESSLENMKGSGNYIDYKDNVDDIDFGALPPPTAYHLKGKDTLPYRRRRSLEEAFGYNEHSMAATNPIPSQNHQPRQMHQNPTQLAGGSISSNSSADTVINMPVGMDPHTATFTVSSSKMNPPYKPPMQIPHFAVSESGGQLMNSLKEWSSLEDESLGAAAPSSDQQKYISQRQVESILAYQQLQRLNITPPIANR